VSRERRTAGRAHLEALAATLTWLEHELPRLEDWGRRLGAVLVGGGRLLAAGNGGSAAQAQHLTGELVGRYRDERAPLSAISLHAETSSLTAIGNDYGPEEAFARQVRAHGRPGDVLVALSTSGASANVLAAVDAANEMELLTWAITGPRDCTLASLCDEAICVEAPSAATVQEAHLVAIHLLCAGVDAHVADIRAPTAAAGEIG
jgi:D-sedoheptulose 7-phosphate isomerase